MSVLALWDEAMTYKLSPEIKKIISPVVLVFPGGERKEYESGAVAAANVFDHKYQIATLRAVDNRIEIRLKETKMLSTNWIGEEQTFF